MSGYSKLRILIAASTLAFGASAASASTVVSGTLGVSITIQAACNLQSATNSISFGTVGVINASVSAQTTVGVQCTNSTPYNLGLNAGAGTGATTASRLMTGSAGATVTYSVYKDSAHTQVWGPTSGVDAQASTGTGAMQTFTVYGMVPAQSTPAPGSYTDTIALTVTY